MLTLDCSNPEQALTSLAAILDMPADGLRDWLCSITWEGERPDRFERAQSLARDLCRRVCQTFNTRPRGDWTGTLYFHMARCTPTAAHAIWRQGIKPTTKTRVDALLRELRQAVAAQAQSDAPTNGEWQRWRQAYREASHRDPLGCNNGIAPQRAWAAALIDGLVRDAPAYGVSTAAVSRVMMSSGVCPRFWPVLPEATSESGPFGYLIRAEHFSPEVLMITYWRAPSIVRYLAGEWSAWWQRQAMRRPNARERLLRVADVDVLTAYQSVTRPYLFTFRVPDIRPQVLWSALAYVHDTVRLAAGDVSFQLAHAWRYVGWDGMGQHVPTSAVLRMKEVSEETSSENGALDWLAVEYDGRGATAGIAI